MAFSGLHSILLFVSLFREPREKSMLVWLECPFGDLLQSCISLGSLASVSVCWDDYSFDEKTISEIVASHQFSHYDCNEVAFWFLMLFQAPGSVRHVPLKNEEMERANPRYSCRSLNSSIF